MQQPPKAYKNLDFLNSPAARTIRIMCEYEEPRQRLARQGVHNTIVFFGSARIKPPGEARRHLTAAKAAHEAAPEDAALKRAFEDAQRREALSKYYRDARQLAAKLTEWSILRKTKRSYYICSGGGPGIMEAANRGAADIDGGRSVGLGISLPFEAGVNKWVTPELAFEFHYFFTRKLWFLYLCKALVIFPGGFGTMDELFETLTLVQTGKITKPLPIVLYGAEYFETIFNLEAMADFGTISPGDVNLFKIVSNVDEAFEYLTAELEAAEG
ncbi:MAG: LOG family protein [Deltaproteobacteria bacterium]|nr:MAG: LOG family protein [Deltaproteobacteria bacterium]